MPKKKTVWLLNAAFILCCGIILTFLLNAPEETTPKLPRDSHHNRLFSITSKKEAERYCLDCHTQDGDAPPPSDANHHPEARCLFCHKRTQ